MPALRHLSLMDKHHDGEKVSDNTYIHVIAMHISYKHPITYVVVEDSFIMCADMHVNAQPLYTIM